MLCQIYAKWLSCPTSEVRFLPVQDVLINKLANHFSFALRYVVYLYLLLYMFAVQLKGLESHTCWFRVAVMSAHRPSLRANICICLALYVNTHPPDFPWFPTKLATRKTQQRTLLQNKVEEEAILNLRTVHIFSPLF